MLHPLELAVLAARRLERKTARRTANRRKNEALAYWERVNAARAVREHAEAKREAACAGPYELWHYSEVGHASSKGFMDRGTEDWCRREARRELEELPQSRTVVVLYLVIGKDWEELGRVQAD